MQMLNVLILVSIGFAIIGFIYSIIADELDGKQGFGFIVQLTFYTLASVFGGTWALTFGLIYGVGGRLPPTLRACPRGWPDAGSGQG